MTTHISETATEAHALADSYARRRATDLYFTPSAAFGGLALEGFLDLQELGDRNSGIRVSGGSQRSFRASPKTERSGGNKPATNPKNDPTLGTKSSSTPWLSSGKHDPVRSEPPKPKDPILDPKP